MMWLELKMSTGNKKVTICLRHGSAYLYKEILNHENEDCRRI